MSKLRVHELARELGRQNREVIEFLKSKGVDVRSHMSMVDEPAVSEVKNKFRKDNNNRGKEHIAKLETPKTEEKVVTAKSEGDKTETPKKKKNKKKLLLEELGVDLTKKAVEGKSCNWS